MRTGGGWRRRGFKGGKGNNRRANGATDQISSDNVIEEEANDNEGFIGSQGCALYRSQSAPFPLEMLDP